MASYGPAMPPGHSSRKSPEDDSDEDDLIGPALPPHLQQKKTESSDDDDDDNGSNELGPALPPHMQQKTNRKEDKKDKEEEEEEEFGVQLPPDYSRWNTFDVDASDDDFGEKDDIDTKDAEGDVDNQEEEEDDGSYGPALPPGYEKHQSTDDAETTTDSNVRSYGPALPPGIHGNRIPPVLPIDDESDEEEEEDDMIGPMPLKPGSEGLYSMSAAEEFEKRAAAMKHKLATQDQPQQPKREAWMMELPGYSTNFGLGPRSFRKTPLPEEGDRSGWTDTPADKARKEKEKAEKRRSEERVGKSRKEGPSTELSQRDKRLSEMVAKHNETRRAESLVDMHTKDRKRKLEEDKDKPVERRPFDRDLDLNVNQFDEAKRKLLIKKSAQLNDKFSHGKDKVFL